MDPKGQAVERVDADALAGGEWLARASPPELAADEDEPAVANDALHADDLLRPDRTRPAPDGHRRSNRERAAAAEDGGYRNDERDRRVVGRPRVVEERDQPDRCRKQPGH